MIISDAEIKKCIWIVASDGGNNPGDSCLPSDLHKYTGSYQSRFEAMPASPNARLKDVKKAVALKRYDIGSDAVAEKLLGRIISDKVR